MGWQMPPLGNKMLAFKTQAWLRAWFVDAMVINNNARIINMESTFHTLM